jgi:tripartite-type tricarboxylate transporter receptor subunit TctC
LHDAFKTAMDSPEFADYVESTGATLNYRNTAELTDQLSRDFEAYEGIAANG